MGAENDQAIRGISLDGCVFDETQSIKPTIFPEVIRPALADRKGWCIFIGTPKGRNSFYQLYQSAVKNTTWYACTYKASETGILDEEELQAARDVMSKDLYEQEFECSFQAAITGSYYGTIIEDLAKEKRMVSNLFDEDIDVETWWDLGMNDQTAIWFVQRYKTAPSVIVRRKVAVCHPRCKFALSKSNKYSCANTNTVLLCIYAQRRI